jgi:hypothetical protein
VSYPPLPPAIGSPVMNESGEVIGVLGGSILPGATRDSMGAYTMTALNEGGMATPITAVARPQDGVGGSSLAELKTNGVFLVPVKRQNDLLYGLLGTNIDVKKNQLPTSREVKTEFSRAQGNCEVLLVWNPTAKLRGTLSMEVYDINNNAVVRSQPNKVKAAAGTYLTNKWAFPIGQLPPSRYRVDVLQDGTPVWRAFFRITE